MIRTDKCSLNYINDDRLMKIELINRLNSDGWSNREITSLLNHHKILKPITKTDYTIRDVWSVINKFQKRKKRMTDTEINIGHWEIYY